MLWFHKRTIPCSSDYISACLSYQPPAYVPHFHLIQENRVSRPLSKVLGGTYRPNLTSEVAHSDLRILHEFALFGSLSISRDDLVGFIGWLTAPVSDKTVALVEDVVLIGFTHSDMVNPG